VLIFILGARPAKVRGQEAEKKETKTVCLKIVTGSDGKKIEIDTSFDDGFAYVYCISKAGEDGKTVTVRKAKTVCAEDDGDWTVTTEEDGEVRVIVKSKKDSEPLGDFYIIKTCEKDKPEKK
jgi:hypothetical protein